MAFDRRDAGANPFRREKHRLHAALCLPAEPHCWQGCHQKDPSQVPGCKHRSHRLRSRCQRGQPAEPYQTDAVNGAEKSEESKLKIKKIVYFLINRNKNE